MIRSFLLKKVILCKKKVDNGNVRRKNIDDITLISKFFNFFLMQFLSIITYYLLYLLYKIFQIKIKSNTII